MPVFQKGSFQVNLGIVFVGGEIFDEDRQCAWELYCELISRVSLMGKEDADGELVFTGEVYAESFESLYAFFTEARGLMRRYPVGRLSGSQQNHLGFFIAALLEVVLRPFLEKWAASYRYWSVHRCAEGSEQGPFGWQEQFPGRDEMLQDWRSVRRFCRAAAKELATRFGLPDVMGLEPPRLKQEWLKETRAVLDGSHA